jgi:hypothetical protein
MLAIGLVNMTDVSGVAHLTEIDDGRENHGNKRDGGQTPRADVSLLARPDRGAHKHHRTIEGELNDGFNARADGDARTVGSYQCRDVKGDPNSNPRVCNIHATLNLSDRTSFRSRAARETA